MIHAIEEFLSENGQRSFPFREDCNLSYGGGILDNSVVIDFRGWHRDRPEIVPQLSAIIGPGGDSYGSFVANAGFVSFYFSAGSLTEPITWPFKVPVLQGTFPVSLTSTVSDLIYYGVARGVARASFGVGVAAIPQDASWIFSGASLEPGLVVEQYRGQVDSIRLIHKIGDDEFVGGDVNFVGGYNTNITPSAGGIKITPTLGGGTLGRFIGSTTPPENAKCSGVLMTINSVSPDKKTQNLALKGANGIEIVNFPEDNRIVIRVAKQQFGGSVCV